MSGLVEASLCVFFYVLSTLFHICMYVFRQMLSDEIACIYTCVYKYICVCFGCAIWIWVEVMYSPYMYVCVAWVCFVMQRAWAFGYIIITLNIFSCIWVFIYLCMILLFHMCVYAYLYMYLNIEFQVGCNNTTMEYPRNTNYIKNAQDS